jgi:TolA-binding protein
MYYVGLCHWENADEKKALAVWTELAQDVDYSKHYLAADALNKLAEGLVKQEQVSRAIDMYTQVAVDFRRTHREAAWEAIQKVVTYHVRSQPSEEKLRAFYLKVRTFHGDPRKVPEDVSDDRQYWGQVVGLVRSHGRFQDTQRELKERYYRYWAGEMKGKFRDWDDFQIAWAGFLREADGDVTRWMARLDQQFKDHQKQDDYARIVKWIRLYGKHKSKALSYYKMIDFSKMKQSQIRELMLIIYDDVQDAEMARRVLNQLKVAQMPDNGKIQVAHDLYRRDGERVPVICGLVGDRDLGLAELLRYYHFARDTKEGIPVAERVASIPKYATEAVWKKAELHEWAKQYKEAIVAYQRADNPPDNLWRIASCYVKLGKYDTAIGQLKEVEAFFKDHAPEAALRIAHLWKDWGKKRQYIASLRGVLKKYPKSGQSSRAHQELEALGIRIGGGIDASD